MVIDRLQIFLGKPFKFNEHVNIYSPTIQEIADIGYIEYLMNFHLTTFDKEKILIDLYSLDKETYQQIQDVSDYEILVSEAAIRNEICRSLAFFVREEVAFNKLNSTFEVNGHEFVNSQNYKNVSSIIRKLNGLSESSDEIKAVNKTADELYKKMQAFENMNSANEDAPELKDILTILCNMEGNGINIFNVSQLTIYQVYEQFEMATKKEEYKMLLPVWSNEKALPENSELPNWKSKTTI